MVAIDYFVGIPSPKLHVPEKFEVSIEASGYFFFLEIPNYLVRKRLEPRTLYLLDKSSCELQSSIFLCIDKYKFKFQYLLSSRVLNSLIHVYSV